MDDENPPTSGSRWEPTEPAAETPAETPAAAPPRRPTWLTRARAGVAGGAVAALLAGGLGGFGLGRATAGQDDGPGGGRQGVTSGPDRGDGSHGGPGLAPGGQVPDRPGGDDGLDDDGPDDGTSGTDSSDT
jgi:hypothetical protein